jgi:hypothetical protein
MGGGAASDWASGRRGRRSGESRLAGSGAADWFGSVFPFRWMEFAVDHRLSVFWHRLRIGIRVVFFRISVRFRVIIFTISPDCKGREVLIVFCTRNVFVS